MKHLEVRQEHSAARSIFNSLLSVSSGDETVRLMLDILQVAHHAVEVAEMVQIYSISIIH